MQEQEHEKEGATGVLKIPRTSLMGYRRHCSTPYWGSIRSARKGERDCDGVIPLHTSSRSAPDIWLTSNAGDGWDGERHCTPFGIGLGCSTLEFAFGSPWLVRQQDFRTKPCGGEVLRKVLIRSGASHRPLGNR